MNKRVLLFLLVLVPVTHVYADEVGPYASVNACIYLPVKPTQPLDVKFTAKPVNCIYPDQVGKNAKLKVTEKGLTCVSVGDVRAKFQTTVLKDSCLTDTHNWILAYKATGGYSGSTNTEWLFPWVGGASGVKLFDYTGNTRVCQTDALCNATEQKWAKGDGYGNNKGSLYIIFKPFS